MIRIEKEEVFGFEAAVRGMRNPMNSWEKSDSYPAVDCGACGIIERDGYCEPAKHRAECSKYECYEIGRNDLSLMKKLSKVGTDHSKYLRMITVYADIVAPLYWLKEFDTYKIGTVANSCSTMHKIHEKEFTLEDFSIEHIGNVPNCDPMYSEALDYVIMALNEARHCYLDTKDKAYWQQMIQLLPSSYNQKRTVMLNYEVLKNMYHARKNHKLDEWREFCKWIETLPYAKELLCNDDTEENNVSIKEI